MSAVGIREAVAGRSARAPRRVRAMVLAASGVNCDRETLEAARLAGCDPEIVHLNQLLGGERHFEDYAFLILPGGFSYGDHLGAGTMLATILQHRFLEQLERFVADGRPVLGICNGFQVLARLGLLGAVALAQNESGRFECRWVDLDVLPSTCLFTQGLESIQMPIAHGEGRVVIAPHHLDEVAGRAPLRYRENPNGSVAGIAGIANERGNVFGLMPHPERALSPWHHPKRAIGQIAGATMFSNAVRYVREAL